MKTEKAEKTKNQEEKEPLWKTIVFIVIIIALCFLFTRLIAYRCVVSGSSMEHTLEDKDNLIAERVSYYFRSPKRFEIIIFKREGPSTHGNAGSDSLIKRVIGLPGETVRIQEGKVYINGEVLEEDIYAMNGYTSAMPEMTLGEKEYFVLGDNRDNSLDSRDFGPVRLSQFEGRAWIRIWPFNKITSFSVKGE